jgi:Asp-tRNA(Asn)/Glu-tRNA(Gln) amidotransferase A subunit family amidase
VKDLLVAKGHPTTSDSRTMRDNVVDLDAPVVERLRRAGAVMLGVRRHINWNNQRPDLKEDLAHLV